MTPPPIDRPVFLTATALLALVLIPAVLFPEATAANLKATLDFIVDTLSWYYVLVVAVIVIACFVLGATRFGEIKLGPDHAEPDYSLLTWFSMLFAAGIGIGLMFFGVAEPVMHLLQPPNSSNDDLETAREAMRLTFFHWGIHGWAIYGIVAAMLAYFGYRQDLPLTLRSALYPLIGERIYGPIGTAVDVFAILSTIFGIATSLGLGVEQINAGLNYLFDVPKTLQVQTLLALFTIAAASVSVALGLDVGIRRLSELNSILAVALLVAVLALGPTVFLLQVFLQNVGSYLGNFVTKSFNLYAYAPTDWLGGWTIFYWGWWISWSPFVGLFIARISRGRTLRSFVFGVLLVPSLFIFLWMTVFGNSAIALITDGGQSALGDAVLADESVALFQFLEYLPASSVLCAVAIVMILVFFVTSADSGAMILNMLSSHGRDDTPITRRLFWTASIGVAAIALMWSGGLGALQTAVLVSAVPFSIVVLFAIWGFARALGVDHAKRLALENARTAAIAADAETWRDRLDDLLQYPLPGDVQRYIDRVALAALTEVGARFEHHGLDVRVAQDSATGAAILDVDHGGDQPFRYEVQARSYPMPESAPSGEKAGEQAGKQAEHYGRAEVLLSEGSQLYCIMGWSTEQVQNDVVNQYDTHLKFLRHIG
ncbi:MAG: BCCT family transporter [Pseudomonadota bacterium]